MSIIESLKFYFEFDFVRYALIAGVLVSLCAALLGVSLVLKRYSMIGDGLSHVAFGAIAVAAVLDIAPMYFTIRCRATDCISSIIRTERSMSLFLRWMDSIWAILCMITVPLRCWL